MKIRQVLRPSRVFYGWWIVAAGSLAAGLGSQMNMLGATVFLLPISRDLGLSRAVISLVLSISRIEGGLLGPFSGWAIDHIGVRRMLTFGSLVAGAGFFLLGTVVHNLWSLLLVYGLVIAFGFSVGSMSVVMTAVNIWFTRRRAVAMGAVNAAWGMGGFVIVPLLSYLVLAYRWRTAALVGGGLVVISAVPAILVFRDSPESMGMLPDGVRREAATNPAAQDQDRRAPSPATFDYDVKQALSTPSFWMMVTASALQMLAFSAVLLHFVPVFVWKGLSQQEAANLLALWSLLIVPISIFGGLLADMLDKRLLLSLGTVAGAVGYFSLALLSNQIYIFVFVILLAVLDNSLVLNFSLMGDYFGRRRFATLRGIASAVGMLGAAVSPVYTGWVWDRTESYTLSLVPFGAALAVSALIYALLPRPTPPPTIVRA